MTESVEEFLKRGGEIQQIERGKTGLKRPDLPCGRDIIINPKKYRPFPRERDPEHTR